jgi:hypothetical protein
MNGQIDINGIYVHPLLIAAILAYALSLPIEWALARAGFYRFVFHRGLFDFAMVVVLWGLIATALSAGTPFALTFPRLS